MIDAISIALTGLTAQKQRLSAAANNIANVSTTGAVPAAGAASTVYQPLTVNLTSLQSGESGAGVRAEVTADADGYTVIYDPSSHYANESGMIAAPNVDLNQEIVSLTEIKMAYKADLSVIRVADEMNQSLMDIIA